MSGPLKCLAVLACLAGASGTAIAGDRDAEILPDTWAASLTVTARQIEDQSFGGPSLGIERAWGKRRWQAFANGRASWYFTEGDQGPALAVGSGLRWLARSFEVDSSAALQLILDGGVEVDHARIAGGVTIPQLWLGWGMQVRSLGHHRRLMVRFVARVHFGRIWDRRQTVDKLCHGCTSTPSWPIDDAATGGLVVAW